MESKNFYLLMEVVNQSKVKNAAVREDGFLMGYEPQSDIEIKQPDEFSREHLVATLSGKAALHQFKKGTLVAVKLSHQGYMENDEYVNHIWVDDIKLVNELDYLYL